MSEKAVLKPNTAFSKAILKGLINQLINKSFKHHQDHCTSIFENVSTGIKIFSSFLLFLSHLHRKNYTKRTLQT